MGVDPAGGAQHPLLGQLAVHPQQRKEGVRLLTVQRPLFRALPKIGVERAGAVKKGKLVHVPVRAAVFPVHQSRLWRDVHLIQQRPAGMPGDPVGIFLHKVSVDQLHRAPQNLLDVVPAAARAGRRHLPADKAAARRHPQLLAGDFGHPFCHHVDIQKPPEGKALLDLHHPSFSGDKVEVDQQVQLVPRPLVALDALSNFRPFKAQLGQDAALALLESLCKKRRALDRPGNIEGQADQRPPTLFQQLPLGVGPPFPRGQNLIERKRRGV